jgi:hypothetical protein
MVRSLNIYYLALPDNVPDPEVAAEPPPPQPAKAAAKRSVISNTMKFSLFLVFISLSPFENIAARKISRVYRFSLRLAKNAGGNRELSIRLS